MNLGLGKLTQNVCVFYTHSKTTLIIYNAPSAFVFDGSIISSLGTSYFWAYVCETAWVASDIAAFPLALLFPISGTTVTKSSRYISIFPWGYTGMSTANSLLWSNGMQSSWVDGVGIESWFGAWFSRGFQFPSDNSAFLRSEIGLAVVLHSDGPFAPPKVSLSEMRTYNVPFLLIWMDSCIAAYADKCSCR